MHHASLTSECTETAVFSIQPCHVDCVPYQPASPHQSDSITSSQTPRNVMIHNFLLQDAMALVHAKGKLRMFITMTCYPTWEEVVTELLPSQDARDRPDLVSCLFVGKLKALLHDFEQGQSSGKCATGCIW